MLESANSTTPSMPCKLRAKDHVRLFGTAVLKAMTFGYEMWWSPTRTQETILTLMERAMEQDVNIVKKEHA